MTQYPLKLLILFIEVYWMYFFRHRPYFTTIFQVVVSAKDSVALMKLMYQKRSGTARSAPWTKKEYISKILDGIGGGKDEKTKQLTTIYIGPLGRIHSEGTQQQQNRSSIGEIIIRSQYECTILNKYPAVLVILFGFWMNKAHRHTFTKWENGNNISCSTHSYIKLSLSSMPYIYPVCEDWTLFSTFVHPVPALSPSLIHPLFKPTQEKKSTFAIRYENWRRRWWRWW